MSENEQNEVTYGDKMYAHLIEADFSIREAVDALAKGNTEATSAACLIAIADCLLSIGMNMSEIRYNKVMDRKERKEKRDD